MYETWASELMNLHLLQKVAANGGVRLLEKSPSLHRGAKMLLPFRIQIASVSLLCWELEQSYLSSALRGVTCNLYASCWSSNLCFTSKLCDRRPAHAAVGGDRQSASTSQVLTGSDEGGPAPRMQTGCAPDLRFIVNMLQELLQKQVPVATYCPSSASPETENPGYPWVIQTHKD